MTRDEVCALSAGAIVAAVRARQLTAERVMECHLARTERLEQVLNTYATLDVQGALRAAHGVDVCIRAGQDPGPLAGLPVSVKDLIAVGGMRQAFGSRLLHGRARARSVRWRGKSRRRCGRDPAQMWASLSTDVVGPGADVVYGHGRAVEC